MKLLFQSDDYGLTDGVTSGILKGIRDGVIRNTGLFVNMDSSIYAATQIKFYPECCFGQDINLVAGKPITKPNLIPNLVDESGCFIKSTEIMKRSKMTKINGIVTEFEEDPYSYEETLIEVENQVKRFIELVGKKPEYLHGHSLITKNIMRAMEEVGRKYNIVLSNHVWESYNIYFVKNTWNPKAFSLQAQIETDVTNNMLKVLPEILNHKIALTICHAGFVDEDIFKHSTYTMIRAKDLHMATSDKIKAFIKENNVELITYRDLIEGV